MALLVSEAAKSKFHSLTTLIYVRWPFTTTLHCLSCRALSAGFYTQGPTQATRLSDSPVRWIGDESGLPNAPDIWSTAAQQNDYSGVGDPRSSVFAPAGCDSVFQSGGWFWEPGGVRSLEDLQLM